MDFQSRVYNWCVACFGEGIALDKTERGYRFLEESLELGQAVGITADEAHELIDYVYGRKIGGVKKEVGDVLITLAALSAAYNVEMSVAGRTGLRRNWENIEKIRAKHKSKPIKGPLPVAVDEPPPNWGGGPAEGFTLWKRTGESNGWLMPIAPRWKRLPVIRHFRALAGAVAVSKHEAIYEHTGMISTGYDQWVLWGMFHGYERKG